MKKLILGLLGVAVTLMSASYTTCATCHGDKAEKRALGKSEIIGDWSENQITSALMGYKNETYGGPLKGIMKGQVVRLSEKDIKTLAKKISNL